MAVATDSEASPSSSMHLYVQRPPFHHSPATSMRAHVLYSRTPGTEPVGSAMHENVASCPLTVYQPVVRGDVDLRAPRDISMLRLAPVSTITSHQTALVPLTPSPRTSRAQTDVTRQDEVDPEHQARLTYVDLDRPIAKISTDQIEYCKRLAEANKARAKEEAASRREAKRLRTLIQTNGGSNAPTVQSSGHASSTPQPQVPNATVTQAPSVTQRQAHLAATTQAPSMPQRQAQPAMSRQAPSLQRDHASSMPSTSGTLNPTAMVQKSSRQELVTCTNRVPSPSPSELRALLPYPSWEASYGIQHEIIDPHSPQAMGKGGWPPYSYNDATFGDERREDPEVELLLRSLSQPVIRPVKASEEEEINAVFDFEQAESDGLCDSSVSYFAKDHVPPPATSDLTPQGPTIRTLRYAAELVPSSSTRRRRPHSTVADQDDAHTATPSPKRQRQAASTAGPTTSSSSSLPARQVTNIRLEQHIAREPSHSRTAMKSVKETPLRRETGTSPTVPDSPPTNVSSTDRTETNRQPESTGLQSSRPDAHYQRQ